VEKPKILVKPFNFAYMQGTPFERTGLAIEKELSLELGNVYGLIGATGSGKSTFCKLISGLSGVTEELVEYPFPTAKLRNKLGFVFQQPEHQIFAPTVSEELCFVLENLSLSITDNDSRCRSVLAEVGLKDLSLNSDPMLLSGGQKRRLAIASILISDPEILILDEPMAGVDGESRAILIDTFNILARMGVTIFWVSHNLSDVLQYCSHCLYFESQGLKAFGRVVEVLESTALDQSKLNRLMLKAAKDHQWSDLCFSDRNLSKLGKLYGRPS